MSDIPTVLIEEREEESEGEGEIDHTVPTNEPLFNDHHGNQTTPILPNLAQVALQRLQDRAGHNVDTTLDEDFQPVRKKRKPHPPEGEESNDENEGQTCSVCLEPWSNSGNHRIASLRCGHLFGYICIEKWLKGQGERCPQCNAKAKKSDIRIIYSKSISAVDTTERDRALKELEEERQARIAAQKSESQAILQYQLAKAECERVKEELRLCRQELDAYASGNSDGIVKTVSTTKSEALFSPFKVIPISQGGGARVLGQDGELMVISRPSTNRLFPGWGLTKVSLMDLKSKEFVRVHDKCIRDVKFSPRGDGMILTTGLDKSLQLTSLHSNLVVQKYSLPVPGWSCCWNSDDHNYMFTGLMNGLLLLFDTRRTDTHVHELKLHNSPSIPITSLTHVPVCSSSASFSCGGVLTGTLDGSIFWERDGGEAYKPHLLDTISGSCTSISFEQVTRHCMASFRPSKRIPYSRHLVCQLKNTPLHEPLSCQVVHQFNGGSIHRLLSRSLLFQRPGRVGELMVAYSNETKNETCICDVNTGTVTQHLSTEGQPCLDVISITNDRGSLLTLLTEHKLYLYQYGVAS